MVGNRLGYPTYVLQVGAFLVVVFSCFRHATFSKKASGCVFISKNAYFIIKRRISRKVHIGGFTEEASTRKQRFIKEEYPGQICQMKIF